MISSLGSRKKNLIVSTWVHHIFKATLHNWRVAFFVHSFLTSNKGIDVTYNNLNLPTVVDFGSGNRIVWSYDVTGAKLRKIVYEAGSISDTRDYLGGIEYINGELDFVATEEGRAVKQQSGTFDYVYDMTDHLGNVRVSFMSDGQDHPVMMQKDAYYPFGRRMDGLSYDNSNDNNYLYNGKELEEEHDLNWYHYGARFYDPQLGRWHTVDPADEFQSPYCYVGNDPILFIDPDGCKTVITIDENCIVTGMNAEDYGDDDPNVYLQQGDTTTLIGEEPLIHADLYKKVEVGNESLYKIVAVEHIYVGSFDNEMIADVKHSYFFPWFLKAIAGKWGTGGDWDFIRDYPNQIGSAFGTIMTSRDAGNVNWGAYFRDRYSPKRKKWNEKGMIAISNQYARKQGRQKEDHSSLIMQVWGYRKDPYKNIDTNYKPIRTK